ncbi:hypothetical protein [Halomicrobium sp. ZPS1]|uniref:Uncharacterized protein n=2 Tax=Halomicrobium mukohataei TaxID=57705 RepID=C7NZJ6_HALMD|nr:hypothetical protein [Halomicrobium sp. ZPS1]ACV48764.1 hypothetical protein Hmuk_2658 [Halomicrobium mukohataei DSM 12286]
MTTVRAFSILACTLVETAALVIWLAVVQTAALSSATTLVGCGILAVGLVVERILKDLTVNGVALTVSTGALVGLTVAETTAWTLWLAVAEASIAVEGFVLAATVLAVSLAVLYTVEDSALRGVTPHSSLLDPGTASIGLVTAVGATAWLLCELRPATAARWLGTVGIERADLSLAGLAVLALAVFVTHNVGVAYARSS